ncbi:MAG TPA: glycosyltransferase [Casimicrobiaceae bacterium]|nr:glycosyltransferase [Casimicrobiaceae bacterium]
MNDALAAQASKDLQQAERIYREVVAMAPDVPDALHMLGVLRFEQGDCKEAAELILRALDLTGWRFSTFRYNLGLVIARAHAEQAQRDRDSAIRRFRMSGGQASTTNGARPAVAVVVPCYNHARFVERAIESVFSQTYRQIEVVVVDDGSTDGSTEIARRKLADSPFPCRFVARENRGATATINEAISLSSAPFVNILNSDDWFSDDRIALMVEHVAASGAQWGFSETAYVDDRDRPIDPRTDKRAGTLSAVAGAASGRATVGFSFLGGNAAISSGNLFFSRDLFQRIGPFGSLRYNHDWEFALRAVRAAEPKFIPAPTYCYRLHDSNTISGAISDGGMREANGMLTEFFRWASSEQAAANPLAPTMRTWGMYFVCSCLNNGWAGLFDAEELRRLASEIAVCGADGDLRAVDHRT